MLQPKLLTTLKTYDKSQFLSDLTAGLTVAVVALPLAMAFAIASGVAPERGIFTAIVAGLLISALGGSRVQIGGPTGAFVVIVAGIVGKFGYNGLILCTLIAGTLLIVLGLLRLGGLIKFIPHPVTTGFTTGIAVVIFSTQIRDLLGLTMESAPSGFIEKWRSYFQHLDTINPAATGLAVGTIFIIAVSRRLSPRLPGMLIAMMTATAVAVVFHLNVETIGSRFGDLPRTLPTPSFPRFEPSAIRDLIQPAITVALLAAIESLLSATVADGMIGGRHRPNMELVAQGVANMASVAFGGIPATGAIARTATNIKSGAKTPVAGIVHAVALALLLLLFAPVAKLIPLAALAGILVVVSYNMSEVGHFVELFRAPRSDIAVLLITFALTVLVDLTVAVQTGIVLASLLFIRKMAEISNVGVITQELGDDHDEPPDPNAIELRQVPPSVQVFEISGPFFFGAADRFKDVMRLTDGHHSVIIIRMRHVPVIDATGLHVLREFLRFCRNRRAHLILSGVHAQPLFALEHSGLWDEVGDENIFGNIDDSLNRAREILGLPPVPRSLPFVPTVARERDSASAGPPSGVSAYFPSEQPPPASQTATADAKNPRLA